MRQHVTWVLQPFLKTPDVAPVYKISHIYLHLRLHHLVNYPVTLPLHSQLPPLLSSQGFHISPALLSPLSETRQYPRLPPSHHPSVIQTPGPPWSLLPEPKSLSPSPRPGLNLGLRHLLTIMATLCLLFFSLSFLPLHQYPVIFLKSKSNYPMPSHNFPDKNPTSTGCGPSWSGSCLLRF